MEIKEIKNILKERKITYIQLAEMSGVPLQTLRAIFANKGNRLPRLDTMRAIESALGLDKEVIVRPEMRPALQKVVDECDKLNDLGLAAVLGFVLSLLQNNPQYRAR